MAEMLNPAPNKPPQWSGAAISEELVLISSRISAGDLNEAKSRLLDIVSRATNDLPTLIALGQVARRLGDNALALAQYRAAATAHPDNVWPRAELALFLRELGYNAEAEETLHACLSDLGCSLALRSKLLVPLGCLLVERGERAAAIRCFSEAVSLTPSFRWAQLELARALRAEKNFSQSKAAYCAVLELSPADLNALLGLGYIAREIGDRREALSRFHAAAEAHPLESLPRAEIAVELSAAGEFAKAAGTYRELLAEFPNHPWAWIGLGHAYRQLGDRKQALDAFRRASRNDPESVKARLELAIELRDAGGFAEAEAIAQGILETDSNCSDAWVSLSLTRRSEKDYSGALQALQQAANLRPGTVQYQIDIADMNIKAENYTAAIDGLESALTHNPNSAELLSRLGDISLLASDPSAALDRYQQAVQSNSKLPGPYIGAVQALADLGCVDGGLAVLEIAERQCGSLPEFFVRRAELFRRRGCLEQARKTLEQAARSHRNLFWLRGKQIELDIAVGELACAAERLEGGIPTSRRERALWHFYRGQLAEAQWQLSGATIEYSKAIELDGEEAWWHHELARVSLLCFELDATRKNLQQFTKLGAAAAALQGRSSKLSQSHLGQILDEYQLDPDLIAQIRELLTVHHSERDVALVDIARKNPDSTAVAIAFLLCARQMNLMNPGQNDDDDADDNAPIPAIIAQFWDSSEIPSDVMALIDTWRTQNPHFQHFLLDSDAAKNFLIENYPREVVVAYQRATEPAQKADIFRLAWLLAKGGYYADVDDRCLCRIDRLAPAHVDLVLYQEEYGTVGNNFIAVIPGHPVIRRALQHAVNSVNRGDRDLIWLATGPGLLTRALVEVLIKNPSWRAVLKRVAILDRGKLAQGVASHCMTAYKKTSRHWSRSAFQIKSKSNKFQQPRLRLA